MNNTIKKAHLDSIHFMLQREKIYHEYDINELTVTLRSIDMTDVLLTIYDYQDEYITDLKQELNETKQKYEDLHTAYDNLLKDYDKLEEAAGELRECY